MIKRVFTQRDLPQLSSWIFGQILFLSPLPSLSLGSLATRALAPSTLRPAPAPAPATTFSTSALKVR